MPFEISCNWGILSDESWRSKDLRPKSWGLIVLGIVEIRNPRTLEQGEGTRFWRGSAAASSRGLIPRSKISKIGINFGLLELEWVEMTSKLIKRFAIKEPVVAANWSNQIFICKSLSINWVARHLECLPMAVIPAPSRHQHEGLLFL